MTQDTPAALPVPTSATGGNWDEPTTVAQRLGDAMQLLCGGKRPPDDMLAGWLDNSSEDLQEFAVNHGPAWAQGIGLIDAAMVMVDQPTEIITPDSDEDHEHRDIQAATSAAGGATGEQPLPHVPKGFEIYYLKGFDALFDALNRAVEKGYLPDAMTEEWEAFDCMGPVAALAAQSPAVPIYRDSTPGLHVGESAFESWYDQYLLTAPVHQSGKQRARDAYAAGMGDPLVAAQSPDSGAGPEKARLLAERVLALNVVTEPGLRAKEAARAVLDDTVESPAELALRSLACWLGVGGYNSLTIDAKVMERRIRDGVEAHRAALAQQGAQNG